jgi:hypothetical protein
MHLNQVYDLRYKAYQTNTRKADNPIATSQVQNAVPTTSKI